MKGPSDDLDSARRAPEPLIWWRDKGYVLLTVAMFASFFAAGLTKPLFSIRARDLGATLWQIGLIGMVGQIASALVQYVSGHRSDRLMRRAPLVTMGMAGLVASTFIVGISRGSVPLYFSEGIGGLATAIRGVGSLALIGDILEGRPNRGRLLGLHRGLSSLAFGLAALIGGSIADRFGSGTTFLLASGTSALGLIASFAVHEAPHHDAVAAQGAPSDGMVEITRRRLLRVLPFLVVVFIWAFANSSAFTFWPVYMSERGFSQTVVTRLWGIAALGEFGAMILAGYLCERWGSHRLVALGLVGMGLVFVGYTQARSIAAFIPIQLFRSFAFSSYSAAAMLYATRMGLRRQRGRMAGLHASASSLGGISGAVAGGGMSSRFGLGEMIAGVGALMALLGLGSMAVIPDPATVDEENAA